MRWGRKEGQRGERGREEERKEMRQGGRREGRKEGLREGTLAYSQCYLEYCKLLEKSQLSFNQGNT